MVASAPSTHTDAGDLLASDDTACEEHAYSTLSTLPSSSTSSSDEQQSVLSGRRKSVQSCVLQMFLWIIWLATCQEPLRISTIDTRTRRLPDHEDIPPETEAPSVLVWLTNGEYWKPIWRDQLRYVIQADAKRVLIRFPKALGCTTFAKEHRLLHSEMKIFDPTQWPFSSLIESVPMHNCGEIFTLVVYGEVNPNLTGEERQRAMTPKIFVLKLTKYGEIRWRDFPELLAHVLGGTEATYPPVQFYVWHPVMHDWKEVDPDQDYRPLADYDFAVLRHKAVTRAPGLSRWVDHLDAQNRARGSESVEYRYMIPSIYGSHPLNKQVVIIPAPIGSPFALSALYLRTERFVSPRAETMRETGSDNDSVASHRVSAISTDLEHFAYSLPGRFIPDDLGPSATVPSTTIKPLDVAQKRKMATSMEPDSEESPSSRLRRSPRNHQHEHTA